MSNLVSEKQQLAKAEVFENPYTLALSGVKILDMKKGEALKGLIDIISTTYFEAGQIIPGYDPKKQAEHLQLVANGFYEDVKSTFRFLRMEEARLAFKNGVRKEYGEYYGLNIATFAIWVKGYLQEQKRKDALQALKDKTETVVKPIMTETEAEYEWKLTIKKQFCHFKETGVLNIQFPSYAFEWFEDKGLIQLSKEQKEAIWEQALTRIEEIKKVTRVSPKSSFIIRNECTAFLNRLVTGQLTTADKTQVKSEARYIALKQYFETVSELNI